ncbi:intercompartmental signaling factor BofC [Caldibacillus lycopersici]|uniref:Intercompartmental signaling factor BofC n=1 Tax=Perspicuibacillus lycopersici TaxID=1325689 RepID=A0AAE3ITR7_9BACI|nr:intercompartmental signaling factor BofC [Perspicuibacillus lycopersici]MCU9613997.1 intercompartmental signaling factor BofC [Perspicuibacillus lycopersici]
MNMKIRLVLMTLLLFAAILDLFFFNPLGDPHTFAKSDADSNQVSEQQLTVVLQIAYLDGEVQEEIITENIYAMDELWKQYKDWKLVDINADHVVLKKYVDDISPLLKANGYFGLTENGTLSIFNGKPEEMQIIHTFFQLDMEKLESTKQDQLKTGIPVRTKNDFQKVLNAFKPYSRTTNQ